MECGTDDLIALVLGDLDEEASRKTSAHVMKCEECARRMAELRQAMGLLERLPGPKTARPIIMSELTARARARESKEKTPRIVRIARHWRAGLAAAAAASFAILCFHYGLSVRVGGFEVAFGPQASPAKSGEAMRQVAREVSREEVGKVQPVLTNMAAAITNLDTRNQERLTKVANDWSAQRATDLDYIQRSFWVLKNALEETARIRTVAYSAPSADEQ
jgi:anti-sigma factor RsiW